MLPSELFSRCLEKSYVHVGNGGDYATERRQGTLYVYLQASEGAVDWKNNLDFPAVPYRTEESGRWYAHRGFLRVWKSIEQEIAPILADRSIESIVTVGYSHGAALAVLCHEYVFVHREDLREQIQGHAFASPRVYWGFHTKAYHTHWERFFVYRNLDDLVTHLPPALFGYSHVGHMIILGKRGRYSPIDAHRPQNVLRELIAWEEETEHAFQAPRSVSREQTVRP